MFSDDFTAAANAAKTKSGYLTKNPLGYLIASVLAGFYVGLGALLAHTIGGQMAGTPYAKTVMGFAFGVALSLVMMAGAELFTGSNLVMAVGRFQKTVTTNQVLRIWVICYIGNWLGSILLAVIFYAAGLATGSTGELIASASATKMSIPLVPLFFRAILCNMLVCLAVWCGFRCKSESAKLIMIFWCLFTFIISGFEHSVANMTLLTVSLLSPFDAAVSLGGYFYNLSVVTLGNIIGGAVFVALPYFIIAQQGGSRR